MAWSSIVRVPRAPVSLVLVVLTSASCADILGLQDPAGSLDEAGPATSTGEPTTTSGTGGGSPVTSTGTSPSGGGGAGGASTSTGGGAGSTTSTGGGGEAPVAAVTELPGGISIEALGRSPGGAVALVKQADTVHADLCSTSLPSSGLTVVAIDVSSPCAVLGQVSVVTRPDALAGHSVEQRGDWVTVSGRAGEGTLTLSVDREGHVADLGIGAGFFGVWDVTAAAQGYVVASSHSISAGAALPLDDGAVDVVFVSTVYGVGSCPPEPADVNRTHFGRPTLDGTCTKPRDSADGFLFDAAQENDSWALLQHDGSCSVHSFTDTDAVRQVGPCGGPAHLLVAADAAGDLTFAGAGIVEVCDFEAGIIEASGALPEEIWCAPDEGDGVERVIPFHVDTTHVHFVRSDGATAGLWAVARGGGDGIEVAGLCTGCTVEDAVASNGHLFVIGHAGFAGAVVLGEPIAEAAHFWAWIPLEDP